MVNGQGELVKSRGGLTSGRLFSCGGGSACWGGGGLPQHEICILYEQHFGELLDEVNKVEQVVETGIVQRDTFRLVYPLVNPARKITISNAAPFIKNYYLCKATDRQIVSPIKMVVLGCKSPKLKHVICHRRQVFMIPKDTESPINLTLRVGGFNYVVFITSETMKCLGCGAEGHLIRPCPKARKGNPGESSSVPAEGARGSGLGPAGIPSMLPCMLFRGRTIVINNLVSSWHTGWL